MALVLEDMRGNASDYSSGRSTAASICTPDAPTPPCNISCLFNHQVENNPFEPAVEFEGQPAISYSRLNLLSNRVAQRLQLQSHTIIPICLDVSVDLIASIVGVLKSGAAYVILDPASSLERNKFIINEVAAPFVLTSRNYSSTFSNAIIVEPLLDDQALFQKQETHQARPIHQLQSLESPAYIIYTSGSTGNPKGVVISHAAASHGITHFSLNGNSKWLLFYNPAFSAAQRTILATLCKGGCLCLASKARLSSALFDVVKRMHIEALGITPSMLSSLSPKDVPSTLRQITTVGEPLTQSVVDKWANIVDLKVSYGLSECAQLNFARRLLVGDNPAIVGRPHDTTDALVLIPDTYDVALEGEVGELCLMGPQLANGYLGQTMESSSKFLSNPFGPGQMFRTGDTAIWHACGDFEILGRLDEMVKVRGQRVEPGEICVALNKHESVQNVAVVATIIGDNKSLVVAVVLNTGYNWEECASELRAFAQKLLPQYMVPSFWLQYDALPTNENGKIDLKAIKSKAQSMPSIDMIFHHRRSAKAAEPVVDKVELIIQEVWAKILHLDPGDIGRLDSFFALGGNSMQAIQMINSLRAKGVDLGLDSLFSDQSLAILRAGAVIDENIDCSQQQITRPFSIISQTPWFSEFMDITLQHVGALDAYPATPLQESLMAATLQGSTDYLYQRQWDIQGLDLFRLKLAFTVCFMRSDILRTILIWTEQGFMQVVRDDFQIPWEVSNMTLEEFKISDKARGFASEELLFRVTVVSEKTLVVSMHHTLFDAWSSAFLYQDVAKLYYGVTPDPRPPFKNFVRRLTQEDNEAANSFWKDYLGNAPVSILNHSPMAQKSYISTDLVEDLDTISSRYKVTSSTIIFAAWSLVLSKHLDSTDISFATPVSGRESFVDGIDRLDGPTLTVVPRRCQPNPEATFEQFIHEIHIQALPIIKHSHLGIRKALKAAGQSSTLFDTMVNILPQSPTESDDMTSLVFKQLGEKPAWQTEYTTLEIEQIGDKTKVRLTSDMEPVRARFILNQFSQTVSKIANRPTTIIKTLSVLTKDELAMLSVPKTFPTSLPLSLHAGYEAQVISTPWRVALQWQNVEILTYRMLDYRANQMARCLQNYGAKRGDFICPLLQKSPYMLIALLAVLKIGAVWVPLSPDNPVERNSFIVGEVGAKILLSEKTNSQYKAHDNCVVILVDEMDLGQFSNKSPEIDISGNDLAYIIFTSGSTGKPKGCVVTHSAAAAGIESMIDLENRRTGEWRALQFSNYIFDASILDIFNTLNSGGTLCMAPTARLLNDLSGVINEMDVTHSFLTPTVARLITPHEVPTLQTLTIGGEPLTEDILKLWAADRRVIQPYGPTETAMVVSMRDMSTSDNPRNLGTPFPTAHFFVVERDGTNLVPYGAIGELCIVGPQVDGGHYLNRPDLTSEVFCDTSLGGFTRMYRSGDLGRWLPNGEIECLGRADNQVKINGLRIELGEIETAILNTDTVTHSVTIVAEIAGKKQLASFIIFDGMRDDEKDGIQPPENYLAKVAELKHKLTGLASYMYPKVLLPLCSVPKLPSGKSNRQLLGEWIKQMPSAVLSTYYFESFGASAFADIVPVQTQNEKLLEGMFTKILGATARGRNANFLAFGGDSICAINLSNMVKKHGLMLPVGSILKSPRLMDMALQIQKQGGESNAIIPKKFEVPSYITDQIAGAGLSNDFIEHVYPCPAGQNEFLLQGQTPNKMWVLMTVRPLLHSPELWISAVAKLTATNEILRTTFTSKGSQFFGVVLKSASIMIDFIDVTSDADREQQLQRIWNSDFKFGQPFIQYAILTHPSGKKELVTKMDHGLYDGTLLRIFGDHFKALQHGYPLPPLTHFRDFTEMQYQYDRENTLKYWMQPMVSPTGFQYPKVAINYAPNATSVIFAPSKINLDDFATSNNITIPIVFQAAFQLFLSQCSGEMDVGFDYLYTGRNIDLGNKGDPQLINGLCANFLPLRSHVDTSVSVKEYLAETQGRFWDATENGSVGLGDIYDAINLSRTTHGNRALFLFQPFEPSKPASQPDADTDSVEEDMRWVYMAGAKVKMNQPYGLVCEVVKILDGYKIKFTIDENVLSREEAQAGAEQIWTILRKLVEFGDGGLRKILS
ncbi:hypothetical protein BP5796_08777 [Coleophoma crateriformis]|uniref:Carrier domain-containing protein n=1 Tax=Coleophoma crateriformis TaxID=565419 RepID=A0A3D8R8U4_9HELO|nr:hypothetical protein BP5796_08777 [Coleophoma crateriformis]